MRKQGVVDAPQTFLQAGLLAACLMTASLLVLPAAADAQSGGLDVIANRQSGQDLEGAVTGDMKRGVAKEDPKPYADGAKGIAAWSRQFPSLVPR